MADVRRALRTWRSAAMAAAAIAAFGFAACSAEDDLPPAGPVEPGPGIEPPGPLSCSSGTTRDCGITLGEHEGVLTCYQGTQSCESGAWTACGGGKILNFSGTGTERSPDARFSQVNPLALSAAADCEDNPCDPYCQIFNEQPDAAISPEIDAYVPLYPWTGGSLTSFPGGLVSKGMSEPCESALDCQFNQRCEYVGTDATCAHDKCDPGAALDTTCQSEDKCVELICAAKPECCQEPSGSSCPHDMCVSGDDLETCRATETCVDAVCDLDPFCCMFGWDSWCIAEVADVGAAGGCTTTCECPDGATLSGGRCYKAASTSVTWSAAETACNAIGTGWHLASIGDSDENDRVSWFLWASSWIGWDDTTTAFTDGTSATYTNWRSGEPDTSPENCVLMRSTGSWADDSCTATHPYVCEGPTNTTTGGSRDGGTTTSEWTQDCVDMVESVCGAYCDRLPGSDSTTPVPSAGECVDWLPGETSSCASAELSVLPACGITLPVCNHGNTTAPAGVLIIHFPANSGHLDKYRDTLAISDFKNVEECYTTEEIPPGQCVNVPCEDASGDTTLGGNREVMINPPNDAAGTYDPIAECSTHDNWTISRSSADCGPPACFSFDSTAPITCTYALPTDPSNVNLDDITVVVSPTPVVGADAAAATGIELTRVGSAAECGSGGFYLDTAANTVQLCPSTCSTYQADPGATLLGEIGCPIVPQYEQTTYSQIYASNCDTAQTRTQWGYLSYSTTLPAGTRVEFSMRTAATEAELAAASWTLVATADSAATEDCSLSGPAPCPVDLYAELGGLPTAGLPVIEVQARLYPSTALSEAPTLDTWDISFSCPPNQ